MEANKTTTEMTAIDILNDRGFKVNSYLPFCTETGIEYYIGRNGNRAAIVALMISEDNYLLEKDTLRLMANDARTSGIKEVILYTNYGCEIHSKYEKPSIVGLDKVIKIGTDGFNVGKLPTPPAPVKETEAVVKDNDGEHTKGEWDYGYGDNSKALGIYTKKMLEEGLFEHPICLISPIDKITDTDKANAQLIVKAVNAHNELVGALEGLVEQCQWIPKEVFTVHGKAGFQTSFNKAKELLSRINK